DPPTLNAFPTRRSSDLIDLARNLKDTANSLTITTDELQALQFQASQNSVKTEQFNASLAKLRVQTIEAAQGNETMRKSFEALGRSEEHTSELQSRENIV